MQLPHQEKRSLQRLRSFPEQNSVFKQSKGHTRVLRTWWWILESFASKSGKKQEPNCHHVYLKFYLRSLPRQYNKETKKKYKVKHEEQYHYLWMICSCLYKTQVSYWLNIKTDRNSREVVHIKTNILKYIAFLYNKSAAHLLNHKYIQQDGRLTKKNYEIH